MSMLVLMLGARARRMMMEVRDGTLPVSVVRSARPLRA